MSDAVIEVPGTRYAVRRQGDQLSVGQRAADGLVWLDEVDVNLLPPAAQAALQRNDFSDASLRLALDGIVRAEQDRGA